MTKNSENDKKSFNKKRYFRLNDEIYDWLIMIKKGTWNNTFYKMKKKYGNETMSKVWTKK
jgi:hypothetical protein